MNATQNLQNPLQIVAEKFQRFRGHRVKVRYPDHLWEEAFGLLESYACDEIADALGINAVYLDKKYRLSGRSIRFTQLKIDHSSFSVKPNTLEFVASNGTQMRMTFHGDLTLIAELAKTLVGIKS